MRASMANLERGAFTYAAPTPNRLARAMKIDRRYADLGLGPVGGSIVALAEELAQPPGGLTGPDAGAAVQAPETTAMVEASRIEPGQSSAPVPGRSRNAVQTGGGIDTGSLDRPVGGI